MGKIGNVTEVWPGYTKVVDESDRRATTLAAGMRNRAAFPGWFRWALALVMISVAVAVVDKLEGQHEANQRAASAAVLADLHSGKISDLLTFQQRCGGAEERIDRPATAKTPAHSGLFYYRQNLTVLFMRHKVGTAKEEAARPYPFALFDEPTFWEINTKHMVSAEAAVQALGCTAR